MRSRSGVAMLLVMLTMVVVVVGVTIVARVRTSRLLAAQQSGQVGQTHQIMRETDRVIRSWLEESSGSIVLPASVRAPVIGVHESTLWLGKDLVEIRITAWDQQGMWPRNSEELGLEVAGLGAFGFAGIPSLGQVVVDGLRYPRAERPDAFGGLVSTHNPWPTRRGQTRSRGAAAININTAPLALLAGVQGLDSVGDLGEIIEQRGAGEFSTYTGMNRDATGNEIRLVSVSRVWSFRVDVAVGLARRSCWCVYSNQGGQWVLVERSMIDEATL